MQETRKQATIGIKQAVRRRQTIDGAHVAAVRSRLRERMRHPAVVYRGPTTVKYTDTLTVQVKGFPLPTLDLYRNRLVREPVGEQGPVVAAFEGFDGPVLVRADYDPERRTVSVVVPEQAKDGLLTLRFPVTEIVGPAETVLARLDPEDAPFRREIEDHWPLCEEEIPADVRGGKQMETGTVVLEKDREVQLIRRLDYIPVPVVFLYYQCYLKNCSAMCPNGAIQFDENGWCFIDPYKCEGQTYQRGAVGADGKYERINEGACWKCFNPTDGQVSTRCRLRKIKKVLHLYSNDNPYECCGGCTAASRVQDQCKLIDHCGYGAIARYTTPAPHYEVDQAKCTGCMLCYDNITCRNNYDDAIRSRTLRMVSYIQPL